MGLYDVRCLRIRLIFIGNNYEGLLKDSYSPVYKS